MDVKFEISMKDLKRITGLTEGELVFLYDYIKKKDRFIKDLFDVLGIHARCEDVEEMKHAIRTCRKAKKTSLP